MNRLSIDMIKLLSFSLIIVLHYGCHSNKTTDRKESGSQYPTEFQSWLTSFPDSLVEHFPNNLEGAVRNYGSGFRDSPMKVKYLTLVKDLTETESTYYNGWEKTPESCMFKIYLNKNVFGFNYALYEDCDEFFPIPEMALLTDMELGQVDYYIVETSKKVLHSNNQYLRNYLPEEWKNGMSRGVGISEATNSIFYWLIMW